MYSTMRWCATGKETNVRRGTLSSSWLWLLSLFTLAGFIETVFWGQMNSFTPLYLPRLGIAPGDVADAARDCGHDGILAGYGGRP